MKKPNMLIFIEKPEKVKAIGPTIVLASNTHLSAPKRASPARLRLTLETPAVFRRAV